MRKARQLERTAAALSPPRMSSAHKSSDWSVDTRLWMRSAGELGHTNDNRVLGSSDVANEARRLVQTQVSLKADTETGSDVLAQPC